MKFLIVLMILVGFTSCQVTRNITEEYIKNNVENHEIGKKSSIKTYSIYKGYSVDQSSYLELTGFKQGKEKKLIIGVDRYYKLRPKFDGEQAVLAKIYYLVLNEEESKLLNTELLKIESDFALLTAERNEESYTDFTIKDDFFISARKANYMSTRMSYIDFWINGKKYPLLTLKIKDKLKSFQSWNP